MSDLPLQDASRGRVTAEGPRKGQGGWGRTALVVGIELTRSLNPARKFGLT